MIKEEAAIKHPLGVVNANEVVSTIISDIATYTLYFKDPILEDMSVYIIVAEVYVKRNQIDIQRQTFDGDSQIFDVLQFYENSCSFYKQCIQEFGLDGVRVESIEDLVLPFIDLWLANTDKKWSEWARRIYELDQEAGFQPINPPERMYSSSVLDIFTCFQGAMEFLEKFSFSDLKKKEKLSNHLINAMSATLKDYCSFVLEDFFAVATSAKDSFVFTPVHIVKMNNILAAHNFLDKMLKQLLPMLEPTVSRTAQRLEPSPKSKIYMLTIISAKYLEANDPVWKTSDSYCSLRVKNEQFGSTNVIRNTTAPSWNHSILVEVDRTARKSDSIVTFDFYHENSAFGADVAIGKAELLLFQSKYDDYLEHEERLLIKPQGSFLVRARKMGEIDDLRWAVCRAQNVLMVTLNDMVRIVLKFILRVVEKAIKQIVDAAQGTVILGITVKQQLQINDTFVAETFLPVLELLDAHFQVFNRYSDRGYDDLMCRLHPITKSTAKCASKGSRKISILVPLFWSEFLGFVSVSIANLGIPLTTHEMSRAKVIESALEHVKSLLYYSSKSGMQMVALETELYIQIRQTFGKIF